MMIIFANIRFESVWQHARIFIVATPTREVRITYLKYAASVC